jgi:hypothetical protein
VFGFQRRAKIVNGQIVADPVPQIPLQVWVSQIQELVLKRPYANER